MVWDVLVLHLEEGSNKPGCGFDVAQQYLVCWSLFFLPDLITDESQHRYLRVGTLLADPDKLSSWTSAGRASVVTAVPQSRLRDIGMGDVLPT
jgi:hypothetical protein